MLIAKIKKITPSTHPAKGTKDLFQDFGIEDPAQNEAWVSVFPELKLEQTEAVDKYVRAAQVMREWDVAASNTKPASSSDSHSDIRPLMNTDASSSAARDGRTSAS